MLCSEGAELVQLPGDAALSWLLPFLLAQGGHSCWPRGERGKELQGAFVVVFTLGLFSAWAALKALFGFLSLVTCSGVLGELNLQEPSADMQIEK